MRIHILLAICVVVVLGTLGAIAYLATQSGGRVSVVTETSAEGQGEAAAVPVEKPAEVPAIKVDAPQRGARSADVPKVHEAAGPSVEAPASETVRPEREKRDPEMEERVRQMREEMVRDLKLTQEQTRLAERALADLEGVAKSIAVVIKDMEVMRTDLRRQAEENQWTPDQVREIRQRIKQEFSVVRRDEVLQIIDDGVRALEGLRPVLTPEQVPALEHKLRDAEKAKNQVLQGDFP
jgi:hypothetical protein